MEDIIIVYKAIDWILNREDASSIGGADNNANNKNAYKKTYFNTYNIININAGANVDNTSITGKKVGNNTNNTSLSQLNRLKEVNKSGLSIIKKVR